MSPPLSLSRGRCHLPRYCNFPEDLVVDGGIKTLGLHLRATCRERSIAHFLLNFVRTIVPYYSLNEMSCLSCRGKISGISDLDSQ